MSSLNEVYSLTGDIKSFAVSNPFVINTNKACYQLGKNLTPFCLYANAEQTQYNVLDFAKFDGIVDTTRSLVDEISDYRLSVYKDFGIKIDMTDTLKKKLLFYDYLMTISICYVEIPKYTTKNGMAMKAFDKFLCTKNPAIMATWMGTSTNEMQVKYSHRIAVNQIEFGSNEIRFVKLNHTKKGNSVSVPRNSSSIENMKCIPLYMTYAFTEGFKSILSDKIIEFKYLKDNGTIRELNSTLNEDILMDYYHDNMFVNLMLQGVDINSVEQGGLNLSQHVNRGYIKIPELGASRYDGTGCRSLNLARLLSMKIVDEVDRTFIDVDLNSVIANFSNAIDYLVSKDESLIPTVYKNLIGEEPEENMNTATMTSKMMTYVNDRSTLLSTTFHRSLHLFMIKNPQWFPLYTGLRTVEGISTKSNNIGVAEEMDF